MSQTSLFNQESENKEPPVKLDPSRTKRQLEIVDKWEANNGKGTLRAVTGFGKGGRPEDKLPTPSGEYICYKDLKIGDYVFTDDGFPTRVTGVFDRGNVSMYRVTFSDDLSVVVSHDHLWAVQTKAHKYRGKGFKVKETKDLKEDLSNNDGTNKWFLPIAEPVQYEKKETPIDPYILGVLIGDSSLASRGIEITLTDKKQYIKDMLVEKSGVNLVPYNDRDYGLSTPAGQENPLLTSLKELGLQGKKSVQKFIPKDYLYGSIDDRLSLLQGLMDTDGTVHGKNKNCSFSTSSKQLHEDMLKLLRSLGGVPTVYEKVPNINGKTYGINYVITFHLPKLINPFQLPSKKRLYKAEKKQGRTRAITGIEYIGEEPCICISVEAESSLYLTEDYIVTHNTRTALLAADRLVNSPNATYQRDVTVIVPSLEIYDSWEKQKKNFDFEIRVFTIQSFVKRFTRQNKLDTSLLILDEFHRYFSDVYGTVFDIVDYSFIFGTTATIDPTDPKFISMQRKCPVIDTVTLEEALENGWVSGFDIYNLGITMTAEEKATYHTIQKKYNQYFKTFDFDWNMAGSCLNDQYARDSVARRQGKDPQVIMIHAVNFFRAVQERKQFLYTLPQKVPIAAEIIRRFSDDIFITFSLSTDFADALDEELGDISVAYHSSLPTLIVDKHTSEIVARSVKVDGKTRYRDSTGQTHTWKQIKKAYPKRKLLRKGKTRRRKEALQTFRQLDKCRAVITAKALDEGFNVPGITASIVASGYAKVRQSIQRLGRMIRKQPGKRAFQIELYVKNTQEEVWLKNRQEDSINIKWITDINEIDA